MVAVGVIAFAAFAAQKGSSGTGLGVAVLLFALCFIPYPALGVRSWVVALRDRLRVLPGIRVGAAWIVVLALLATHSAAAGRPEWDDAARTAVYGLALIALTLLLPPADPLSAPWRFAATLVLLWVPVEAGWVRGLHLPPAPGGLDLTALLVVDLVLMLFLVVRPVRDLGFCFDWGRREPSLAALAWIAFAVIALPIGLATGFLHYGWQRFDAVQWFTTLLSIYFFTALPEEIFFRGLVQNLIEKLQNGRRWRLVALVIASVIFGAAHLDNPPAPNLRYACFATVAGVAYGAVWMRTRKVTLSALTHAGVDIVWVLMFRGG